MCISSVVQLAEVDALVVQDTPAAEQNLASAQAAAVAAAALRQAKSGKGNRAASSGTGGRVKCQPSCLGVMSAYLVQHVELSWGHHVTCIATSVDMLPNMSKSALRCTTWRCMQILKSLIH